MLYQTKISCFSTIRVFVIREIEGKSATICKHFNHFENMCVFSVVGFLFCVTPSIGGQSC